MSELRDRFEREFVCPKCRGRGALAQEVLMGRVKAVMLPLPAGRYLAVSCALCGFTEFYHLGVVAKEAERKLDPASGPISVAPPSKK